MAGTWVRTGTITVTSGSKKITGVGTSWLSNLLQKVGKGCMCVIDNVISEVDYVNSDTELYLVEAWEGATASGKKYKIQVTVTDTIPELSSRISQSLAYANGQYGNLESWATGAAANVTLTGPAGNQVTLPNLAAMNSGPGSSPDFDLRSPAQLLRWQNYGQNHVIFDASLGKSPTGSDIDRYNPQFRVGDAGTYFPTIMGWNGLSTYGVRVDSARRADSAANADGLSGGICTIVNRDFRIYGKRAMVGFDTADGDYLNINHGGDFAAGVIISGSLTTDYAYISGAQPQAVNALTRKDYVDNAAWHYRWDTMLVPSHAGGDANGHYNSAWDGNNVVNAPSSNWFFFRELYHSGGANFRHQEAFDFFNNEEYFRRSTDQGDQSWVRRWNGSNFVISEGTFTPYFWIEGVGYMSTANCTGEWQQRGNKVSISGRAAVNDVTDYNNSLAIVGLPFISSGIVGSEYYPEVSVSIYNCTIQACRSVWGVICPGTSTINLFCLDNTTGQARRLKASDITSESNAHVRFSLTHRI